MLKNHDFSNREWPRERIPEVRATAVLNSTPASALLLSAASSKTWKHSSSSAQ
jgi:hypothetical protein